MVILLEDPIPIRKEDPHLTTISPIVGRQHLQEVQVFPDRLLVVEVLHQEVAQDVTTKP